MSELGIVIIGRNEGARLVRCLSSIASDAVVVYVDSGSSDRSVAVARDSGALVVELDMNKPFTAARARNAGRDRLPAGCRFVQFIDGDCTLQPSWLAAARAALDVDDGLAAVFGRRREIAPDASRYNWLCDQEWAVPSGPASYFGGDVMIRLVAIDSAGGYCNEMIAGEEPDLAIRMRTRGWRLECLAHEMTLHDAAITRFSQWWRRAQRSGHAYAELAARNQGSTLHDYSRRLRGALFWGLAVPLSGLVVLASAALLKTNSMLFLLAGVILLTPLAQLARLLVREAKHRPLEDAVTLAIFLMLAKPAQSLGIARFWLGQLRGTRSRIIEYKGTVA